MASSNNLLDYIFLIKIIKDKKKRSLKNITVSLNDSINSNNKLIVNM